MSVRAAAIFSLLTQFFFVANLSATTRAQVVAAGPAYSGYSWTCHQRNLLDADDDGIDDRPDWPFATNSNYTGEAYSWGYWDKPSDFGSNVNLETANWIAGKRDVDALPPGYAGFTGLDCSGFVSRILSLASHQATGDLQALSVPVSTSDLKMGDLLFVPGHVVVFTDGTLSGNSMSIMHAVTWRYGVSQQVRRAVSESTEYRVEDGILYLRSKSKPGDTWEEEKVQHSPYSPFPQFQAISPGKDTLINEARPEIKVTVKAGTNIIGSSIRLKIDNVEQTLPTYSDAKQIQVSFTPSEDLSDGQHILYVYAKNTLNLEDDTSVGFPIADPQFLVEREKLMFAKFSHEIC
ncbi:MAG: hypothetical protein WC687_04475 [Patescibacteria group bacterium]|jgi:cell wall-associated NlpC family hydrolase